MTTTNTQLTVEQAVERAEKILQAEAAIKQMKDELKSFVEQNGDLAAGGKLWAFSESHSLKLTSEQTREVAKEIAATGTDAWGILKVTCADLEKLGWTHEKMKNFGTLQVTKRFGSKALK